MRQSRARPGHAVALSRGVINPMTVRKERYVSMQSGTSHSSTDSRPEVEFIPTFIPTFLRSRGFERFAAVNGIRCFTWSEALKGNIGQERFGPNQSFDIFEGTEQIQQLVISRAISGMRIE